MQSVETMAMQIERALRLGWTDDTHYFYHVWTYIKKARVMSGRVERLHDDFTDRPMDLLTFEQKHLDIAKEDPDCLNNNLVAYVPKWMGITVEQDFQKWLQGRNKKVKSKTKKK